MNYLVALAAAALAVAAGYAAVSGPPSAVVIGALSIGVGLFAFFSPRLSIFLIIASMLLSPEIGLGGAGNRQVVLRYDDIIIVIAFLAWLARTAVFKEKPFITSTPVQAPILLYTIIVVLSTSLGILRGDIRYEVAAFYVLKYVEYFMLYFMVVNILDSKEDLRRYLKFGLLVAFTVTVYAYYYYVNSGPDARATAPFEAAIGDTRGSEPASLGGYYLLVFGFLLAMLTEFSGRPFLFTVLSLSFMLPAFLLTFSRASYLGLFFMAPLLVFLSARRKIALAVFFVLTIFGFSLLPGISGKVMDRISMTYSGTYATRTFTVAGVGAIQLEDSAAARVDSLRRVVFEKLPRRPLLGWGVTGIGIGDTQYAIVLGELGLAGFFVFFWMLYTIFITARRVYLHGAERWERALALGLMVSLGGLLVQSLGVNTFIVVRIMGPFWFLTAVIMVLHRGLGQDVKPKPASAVGMI